MTTSFSPSCGARMAVTYPPGPLPMMARSYLGKRLSSPAGGTTLDSCRIWDRIGKRPPSPPPLVDAQRKSSETNRSSILTVAPGRRNPAPRLELPTHIAFSGSHLINGTQEHTRPPGRSSGVCLVACAPEEEMGGSAHLRRVS